MCTSDRNKFLETSHSYTINTFMSFIPAQKVLGATLTFPISRINCWSELLKVSLSLPKKCQNWHWVRLKVHMSQSWTLTPKFRYFVLAFFWKKHPKFLKTSQNSFPASTQALPFLSTQIHGILCFMEYTYKHRTEQSPASISNWTLLSVNRSLKSCLEAKFSSLTQKDQWSI